MRRTLIAALLLTLPAAAEQLAIRITGQAQPNCWSVDDIVEGVTRGLTTDREKALALHRFGMAHFIHFNGPIEERGEFVSDPLKLIGVYGYALCGNNSCAMSALYNRAGLRARTRSITGHSVPEAWFENKWNYIDTDMFGYVFLDDGKTLASVDELVRDPGLFVRQKNPPDPFFPFDEKPAMAGAFRRTEAQRNFHPYANAHLMNLALRTNEAATLYYRPQNRYLLTTIKPPDLGILYKDYWTLGPVRRGSLAWCDEKPATYGNGLLEYTPDLRSEAFRLENSEQRNVAIHRDREHPPLATAQPGEPASVEFEMSYPWVIAGLQNDLTDFDDDTDGAVVSGLFWRREASDENRILVSTDNGQSWKKVWDNRHLGAVPFQVDVTRYAKGRYSYRLRFEFRGHAGLESLKVRTWVALSPMALPRLVPGRNRFEIATAPRRTYYHESRWEKGEGLEDEQGDRAGVLTFRLGPKGPVEEARIAMQLRKQGSGPVSLSLDLSEDAGATWKPLESFAPHAEHQMSHMWFNHLLRGRLLDGARTRLRLTVARARLEKVIANSVLREEPRAKSALRISHTWNEGATQKTFTHAGPAPVYEIDVPAARLANHSIRLVSEP
ncbi:MAG: hypothetical protein HY822_14000 [Acidobacteria bacterium]|nr:hypothetical protein [Acidobacteriota bacterium]